MGSCQIHQRFFCIIKSHFSSTFLCDKYYVQTTIEHILGRAESFFHKPFHTVPYDTVSDFFAYAYAYSVYGFTVFSDIHHYVFICEGNMCTVYLRKLGVLS